MYNGPKFRTALFSGIICLAPSLAQSAAVDIPGPAAADRIQKDRNPILPAETEVKPAVDAAKKLPVFEIPQGAENYNITIDQIDVEGVTIFTPQQIEEIYKPYLGKEVTLDKLWEIAEQITRLYNDNGYFLSMAYVPPQEINGGTLQIKVVEGYVEEVSIEGDLADSYLLSISSEKLKRERPANIKTLESELLLLNDLAGKSFRSVLEPIDETAGRTRLRLIPQDKENRYSISVDNYGSRYLGPYQHTLSAQFSLLPFHQTSLAFLGTKQTREMKYYALTHEVALRPDLNLRLSASNVYARPGFRLYTFDVQSQSASLGVSLDYKLLRQRDENLTLSFSFEGKNTNTNVLKTPQTRDRVRAARLSFKYNNVDSFDGYNNVSATYSQGVPILNPNEAGEFTLSRGEARPDFNKVEFAASRLQQISGNFAIYVSGAGQYSEEPLYSSEEFGYGGMEFGRAYDSSEITGDSGAAASVEIQYFTTAYNDLMVVPYIFYDIGKVWNEDSGGKPVSASSTGLGTKFEIEGVSANLSMAYPLTKSVDAPIYSSEKGARYIFRLGYEF